MERDDTRSEIGIPEEWRHIEHYGPVIARNRFAKLRRQERVYQKAGYDYPIDLKIEQIVIDKYMESSWLNWSRHFDDQTYHEAINYKEEE